MVSFEFTMLAIICLGNTDATTVPRLKDSPAKNVFTTVGKTIELKWTFEVNLTEYPDASLQFLQPSDRLLYYVEIAANQIHPSKVLNGIPFLNRITWTGNVADNSASFTFSNVTRDLSLTYFLALLFSGHQSTEPVILDVLEPPTFVVKKTHQEKVIREGKNLTENCTTVWQLPMTVKWIKDGFSLFNGTNSSTLNIKAINRSQSGIYSCEGTNNVATIRRWINVSVLYPVTIKRLLYSTRKSFIGQSATFRCFSDGYPKPVYEWKTPNPNGRHNSSREDNSSILNVEFVSSADFGNYTCSVKNSISNSSRTVPVTQLFRPNKISSITYDRRPFGVLLLWNKTDWDGGSNVTGYILSVSDENSDPVEHKKIPETRFDVENLKKNTNYTICVQAENIVGKSNKTCVHIKTLNEGKPERPANLKVTPHRGIVVVTWEIPSQDVLYYVVMYKKEGLGKWSEKNISGLKGSVKCDLENLEPGNYVVQVVAVNKYGFSQASKSKTFTVVLPTPKPPRTQRSTTANPDPEKNESEKPKTIVIAISVLIGLLLILAVVFFALWMKRRTGRENPPAHPVEHVPGPLNGDVYAMVETAKKTSKKSKNESDLVYAELSDLSPTGDEEKPPTYVPTDYADIAQILTPDGDLTYSNVQPRCAEEGTYANVKDMGTK